MDIFQLIAGIVLLALVAFLTWHYLTYWGISQPGLTIYPFIGALPELIPNSDEFSKYITPIIVRTPNLTIRADNPGNKWLLTSNPESIEHVLKDNFSNYVKGETFIEMLHELLGIGIFNSDGEAWKLQRKIASYEFSTNSLRSLLAASVGDEISQRLLPVLDLAARSGKQIDMNDVLLRFSFDNICRVGFGMDPGALSPDLPDIPFARSFDAAVKICTFRFFVPPWFWKLMRFFKLGSEGDLEGHIATIDSFAGHIIAKRRAELDMKSLNGHSNAADGKDRSVEMSDILSRMISLGEKDHGQLFSDRFLRDACLNFIIAGRDTTANALSWFFWLLTQHPEVEDKVVEEVRSIQGKRDPSSSLFEAPFTFDELKELRYTHAALNESLRLYPAVPLDTKYAVSDDRLPDGTFVGKGWRVSYCIYSQGRATKLWGADAAEYRPERWFDEKGALRTESPFKFPAFNAGPRLCLGKDMAYVQMKSITSSVLLRYKLKLVPGHQVVPTPSLTLGMKYGLAITVVPRSQ